MFLVTANIEKVLAWGYFVCVVLLVLIIAQEFVVEPDGMELDPQWRAHTREVLFNTVGYRARVLGVRPVFALIEFAADGVFWL